MSKTHGAVQAPQGLVSIQQAARDKSVHPDTIRRRIASGQLKAYRFGDRLIRVNPSEVDALLRPIPTVSGGSGS